MKLLNGYLLFLVVLLFNSCVTDKVADPEVNDSIEYFPLVPGKYIEYEVDSIVFDDIPGGNVRDSVHFEIKEQVLSYVINPPDDTIFYIQRFRRENPSQGWQWTDLWTARRNEFEAVRTEENLTFRKMAFPLKDGKRWIATAYIHPSTTVKIGTENVQAYQEWESVITEYDISDTVNNFDFQDGEVAYMLLVDTDDNATKRYVMEKYARGIGLISRVDTILDSRCIELGDFGPCLGRPWFEHASKGYILSQKIIGHN